MVQHVHGCGGLHLLLQRGSAVAVCGVLLNQPHGRKQYAQRSWAQAWDSGLRFCCHDLLILPGAGGCVGVTGLGLGLGKGRKWLRGGR